MSSIQDRFLDANAAYQHSYRPSGTGPEPSRRVAVLTCMDARIDVFQVLGLELGEAHIIRNAGGIATDDSIRSLCLSQHVLKTNEVAVVQHTNCGLENFDEAGFLRSLEATTGIAPSWTIGAFSSVEQSVRNSVRSLRQSPFLLHTEVIRGYVFDVDTGVLRPVAAD